MAQNFMIEYGILPQAEAETLYKDYIARKRDGGRFSQSSVKSSSAASSSHKKPKKVEVIDETGGDTGFEGGSRMEGIGMGAL